MKRISNYLSQHRRYLIWALVIVLAVLSLMLFRLGLLTAGLSPVEHASANAIYGWHGLGQSPFYLPLNVVRSLLFSLAGHHGALLTRLPNTVFGAMAIVLFALLIKYWHGNRTALLATALFACNAWLLHVSRLASNDVLYLWAIPLLLVTQLYMSRPVARAWIWYGSIMICVLLLYIPGMVWFILLSLYWQRAGIVRGWQGYKLWWQRSLYVASGLIWLPLLLSRLTALHNLKLWLGLPVHFAVDQVARQVAFVPVHLLVRGPNDPERWLAHALLLDAFCLIAVLSGIWFYVAHFRATRSRLLASYWLLGIILVGLGGPVGISLLLPLVFVFAATGIAYLLHEWLRIFPNNPIARKLGIGLVVIAVLVSCSYNLRAYFVAWPHNAYTLSLFTRPSR